MSYLGDSSNLPGAYLIGLGNISNPIKPPIPFPNAIIGSPSTSANTFPNAVTVGPGDSVSTIANTIYGDTSLWREVAVYNGLTLFSAPIIGTKVNIPNKTGATDIYASLIPSSVVNLDNSVKSRVSSIINNRNIQTISKILGTLGIKLDTAKILQSLDLSNLTKGLPNPSNQDIQIYRLIQWVL